MRYKNIALTWALATVFSVTIFGYNLYQTSYALAVCTDAVRTHRVVDSMDEILFEQAQGSLQGKPMPNNFRMFYQERQIKYVKAVKLGTACLELED